MLLSFLPLFLFIFFGVVFFFQSKHLEYILLATYYTYVLGISMLHRLRGGVSMQERTN